MAENDMLNKEIAQLRAEKVALEKGASAASTPKPGNLGQSVVSSEPVNQGQLSPTAPATPPATEPVAAKETAVEAKKSKPQQGDADAQGILSERTKAIQAIIAEARNQKTFTGAMAAINRCAQIVGDPENPANTPLLKIVALAKEECLGNEINRLSGDAESARGEILANHPQIVYWRYYYDFNWRWNPSGVYSDPTSYERAMTYFQLFAKHNANVAKLDRIAGIAQGRIKEVSTLQMNGLDVAWQLQPEDLLRRIKQFQIYPPPQAARAGTPPWSAGERIAVLAVPRQPQMLERQPRIGLEPSIIRRP